MRGSRVSVLLGALSAVAGCGPSHAQYAAVEVGAPRLDCPHKYTSAWYSAGARYIVRGCGREVVVECPDASNEKTCLVHGDPRPGPLHPWNEPDDDARKLEAFLHQRSAAVLACRPGAARLDLDLRLQPGDDGSGQPATAIDVEPGDLSEPERACVKEAVGSLHGVSLRKRLLVTFGAPPPGVAGGGAAAGDGEGEEPPEPAGQEPPQPARGGAASASFEQRLRDALEAQAAAVLACVGSESVVVVADYDARGSVELSLRAPLAGSPEEGCVRNAVGALRLGPAGGPGRVIHLLRQ